MNNEQQEPEKMICPECGSDKIEILDDEGKAICTACWLEWPYAIG